MKKEDLIVKWLDNNCDERELKAFNQLDASSAFKKIDQAAQCFKAPEFDPVSGYKRITERNVSRTPSNQWMRYAVGIAAALVLSLGVYVTVFPSNETTFLAQNAQKTEFLLPDTSRVILNADSQITFDEGKWQHSRELTLDGEAYFRVSKGSKFTVYTPQGSVSVLGTQFTVNSRPDFFEVVCYEGLVEVNYEAKITKLSAGERLVRFGKQTISSQTSLTEPAWLHAKSSFTSVPFFEVVQEMERQYNIKVELDATATQTLFTGSFTHENLETALRAITIPLNLSYDIKGNTVVLKTN